MGLPNLSRAGWYYYAAVVITGGAALVWAGLDLASHSALLDKNLAFLLAFTVLSVFATVQVPALPITLSVAEVFFFMILLLYGAGAGTLAVAVEALVVWWRFLRRGSLGFKIVFTLCANCLAMAVGGALFFFSAGVAPLASGDFEQDQVAKLILPLLMLALVYFFVSSWLVAFAVAFERRSSAVSIWRQNFAALSLNYLGAASLALLFVVYVPLANPVFLLVIGPPILLLYFTYATTIKRVEDAKRHLESLNSLYLATIETLATAIDAKDQVTHGHIRRVQHYAVALAKAVGVTDEPQIRAIEAASLLHDMGKLAVPDYILNKPGPLTPTEFDRMKTHASVGADILSSIQFPYPVVPVVRHHHESWDGTGYPDGLKGEGIPIGARILSVVDCFDALTSDRPYRPRLSNEAAVEIIRERRGTMYDPLVVDKFEEVRQQIAVEEPAVQPRQGPLAAITQAAASSTADAPVLARFDEISASSEEMLTLYEIARAVSGPFSFDDAAEIVARHLRRLIPATYCVFYTYEADGDELVSAYASGDSGRMFAGLRIAMGQRLTGWVGANRQTILNSDPVLDLGESARAMQPPLKSALSTALVSDTALVGVLTLYSSAKNAFNEDHRRIIEAVSRQVSGTLRNAIHFEERKKSSLRDDLTGLPSIERLWNITASLGEPGTADAEGAAVILVDVDRLHDINQRFGRSVGDDVLARVAATIHRSLEGSELLFRNPGDEFVVFLARADRAHAERRAGAIRRAVLEAEIANPLGTTPVSVSVAVASVPADGKSIDIALGAAQGRLHGRHTPPEPGSIH